MGLRTGSYGSLQQQYFTQNGVLQTQPNSIIVRKPSKMSLSGSREKERLLPFICRYISKKKVGMVILVAFALLAFISGFSTVNKGLSNFLLQNFVKKFYDTFRIVFLPLTISISYLNA